MILISFLLICLFIFLVMRKITNQGSVNFLLIVFLLACANVVFSFEICSLLGTLDSPVIFLLIQGVLAAAVGCFSYFYKKGVSSPRPDCKAWLKRAVEFAGRNKLLFAYFLLVAVAFIFLAYTSTLFPQNTSDALYNHLSRIGHWMQQGSLKPYESFNNVGISFPVNNSLLMMWSILLAKTGKWVGLVQWFAAIALALSIFGLAKKLSFKNSQALFAALLFLTFPIVIFESTTAQNDILAAAFVLAGLYLMISGFTHQNFMDLIFAAVSIGLAVGTKQYVLFAFPGAALFLIYFFFKDPTSRKRMAHFCLMVLGSALLLGSYAYIQNTLYWKNPMGPSENVQQLTGSGKSGFLPKLGVNSTRLFTQFISCEGLPLSLEDRCLTVKGKIFRQVFASTNPGLEDKVFLLEPDCTDLCFSFSTRYPYNEESAWYGWISWMVMIPTVIIGLIRGIRKHKPIPVLLILTGLIYFLLTSIVKAGWDPYQGRYLILSTAIFVSFSAMVVPGDQKTARWLLKILSILIGLMGLFIMVYSIASNDARNLVSTETVRDVQNWGREHSMLVAKVAYKLEPQFRNSPSYYDLDYEYLKSFYQKDMSIPLSLVDEFVPADAHLGILSAEHYFFDYYFFGQHYTRKVFNITQYQDQSHVAGDIKQYGIDYLLVSPELDFKPPSGAHLIASAEGWQIYQLVQ